MQNWNMLIVEMNAAPSDKFWLVEKTKKQKKEKDDILIDPLITRKRE